MVGTPQNTVSQSPRDRFAEATATTNAATTLQGALAAFETARQEGEKAHAARRLLPLALEADRLRVVADIARAAADLDAALGELQQRQIEREKNAQLIPLQIEQLRLALEADLAQMHAAAEDGRAEQHEARARRERQRQVDLTRDELDKEEAAIRRMELAARRQAAEARLRQAAALSELRGQAERYQAEQQVYRAQAEAEKLRRAVSPADGEAMPEHLRRHVEAELAIKTNRAPAEQIAKALRDRAAAAGRTLTEEEQEALELWEAAAEAAEGDIRRSAASDLEE